MDEPRPHIEVREHRSRLGDMVIIRRFTLIHEPDVGITVPWDYELRVEQERHDDA